MGNDYLVILGDGTVEGVWFFVDMLEKKARALNTRPRGGDRVRSCDRCGNPTITEQHHVTPVRAMIHSYLVMMAVNRKSYLEFFGAVYSVLKNSDHALFGDINGESNTINVCPGCHHVLETEARRKYRNWRAEFELLTEAMRRAP